MVSNRLKHLFSAITITFIIFVSCLLIFTNHAQAEDTLVNAHIDKITVGGTELNPNSFNNFTNVNISQKVDIAWSVDAKNQAIHEGDRLTIDIDKLIAPSASSSSGDVFDEDNPNLVIGKYKITTNTDGSARAEITFNNTLAGREYVHGSLWYDAVIGDKANFDEGISINGDRYVSSSHGFILNGNRGSGMNYGLYIKEYKKAVINLEKAFVHGSVSSEADTNFDYFEWIYWGVVIAGNNFINITDIAGTGTYFNTDTNGNLIFDVGIALKPGEDAGNDTIYYSDSPSHNNMKFRKLSQELAKQYVTDIKINGQTMTANLHFPDDNQYIICYKTIANENFAHMDTFYNTVHATDKNQSTVTYFGNSALVQSGATASGERGYFLAQKVNQDGQALKNVSFNLKRVLTDGNKETILTVTSDEQGFIFIDHLKMKNTKYILEEVEAPAGYKTMDPVEVKPLPYNPEIANAWKNKNYEQLNPLATKLVNMANNIPPTPQPNPDPDPKPNPDPDPDPTPDPQPNPNPNPQPDPDPEPTPDPKPNPNPEPKPQLEPPSPKKQAVPKTSDGTMWFYIGSTLCAGIALTTGKFLRKEN